MILTLMASRKLRLRDCLPWRATGLCNFEDYGEGLLTLGQKALISL